ncbi:MAG: hypothetical protein C0602_02615 [Denitrovibrio sp.]|nr:MAG: hypothetical protein C0602_02615 [Denitrovibrio sp.]
MAKTIIALLLISLTMTANAGFFDIPALRGVFLEDVEAPIPDNMNDIKSQTVRIRVTGQTQLLTGQYDETVSCVITGEAFGDNTNQRVHITLENLVCSNSDKTVNINKQIGGSVISNNNCGIPGELKMNLGSGLSKVVHIPAGEPVELLVDGIPQ